MPPEPKANEEKPPVNEEITKVLEDLREAADKINKPEDEKPAATTPTYADQREADRKALGFTEEQMQAHERGIARAQAPVIESTAWAKLEKRPDIDMFRKEIETELSIYPQERRTPDLVEKVYYMVKGRRADSKPVADPKKGAPDVRVSRGPGYTGADPGLTGKGADDQGADDNVLDDREKFVAEKLGVTEADYAKSKKVGKHIRELRIPDARPATSLADVELRRLQGRR